MTTSTAFPLSSEELEAYAQDGLFVPQHFRIPDQALERLRSAADVMIECYPDPDLILVAHLPDRPGVAGGIAGGEEIFAVAIEPTLLDLVEQVLGPDIVLWGSSLWAKPAGVGRAVQWHQEANYWPMTPLVTVSVWVSIDGATVENGCMRFIPHSHRGGLLAHSEQEDSTGVLRVRITPGLVDESIARDAPVPAGGVAMLDTHVIHGSNANHSDRRRAALTIRYMPASSCFARDHEDYGTSAENTSAWSTRPIWLVRGENRNPGNDFRIGHEGLEDIDELAERGRQSHGRV